MRSGQREPSRLARLAVIAVFCSVALIACTSDSPTDSTNGPTVRSTEPVETEVVETEVVETQAVAIGETVAETDATGQSTAGSSDQLAGGLPFVLRGSGVDDAKFGDDLNQVKETFVAKHGEPDDDSGWTEQQAPCDGLGTKHRSLRWGDLVLEFSNGPTEFGPANSEHLIAFYSDGEAESRGVVASDSLPILDQTVASIRKRFPGAIFEMNEIAGPEYRLPEGVAGAVTGLGDADTTQTFRAGLICID